MTSPITALAELSEYSYSFVRDQSRRSGEAPGRYPGFAPAGSLYGDFQRTNGFMASEQFTAAYAALSAEPNLAALQSADGQNDPTIFYPGGGMRQPFLMLVSSLLVSAAQLIYYQRVADSKETFVRFVLENYEEMLRAARGERARVYSVVGFTGIDLDEGSSISTPWGILRSAPPRMATGNASVQTTAVLTSPRLLSLEMSRDEYPSAPLPDGQWADQVNRTHQVLPLAVAFATIDTDLCVPVTTFEALAIPFIQNHSYSTPIPGLQPTQRQVKPSSDELQMAEDWSRRLESNRPASLQVAERRLTSAASQRVDKSDALIDAIIAWESMVGTRSESVFRITAALSCLLQSTFDERRAVQRDMQKLYDTRSRLVHGELVDVGDVAYASERSISIGLQSLRALYERGGDWLSYKSTDRANRLILEN